MGTPLPENPVGSDCVNCWGTGKPFGDKPTPEIITITLFDLQEGDLFDPAVGAEALIPTKLFQTELPCRYRAENSTIVWEYFLFASNTFFAVSDVQSGTTIFIIENGTPCLVSGPQDEQGPSGVFAFGGFYEMTFSEIFT